MRVIRGPLSDGEVWIEFRGEEHDARGDGVVCAYACQVVTVRVAASGDYVGKIGDYHRSRMFIASSLLTRELGRSEGFWLADVLGAAHRDVVEAERPEWGTERAMSTPGFEEADAAVDRAEDIVDPIFERGKTVAVHLDLPDSSRLDKVTAAAVADRVLALVRWNR